MTMPTTAIGIWAYCVCEKIGSSAPYFRTMLLMAAIAATSEICDKKLQAPSERVRQTVFAFRQKSAGCRRTILLWNRYQTASAAVSACPSTVATAAPIMPHLQTNRKTGSRMIFTTAPASVESMAKRGLPSARITGFMACPNT